MRHTFNFKIILSATCFFMLSNAVFAQFTLFPANNIPVTEGNNELKNPWAGGLNAPQFSTIDLNFDGWDDLYIFDSDGNKSLTFINEGKPNESSYMYAPKYQTQVPQFIRWVLMRDYNNDGIVDLFAHDNAGFQIWKGDTINGNIKFDLYEKRVRARNSPTDTANIFVLNDDIPAIEDIDGDGDLDILAFGLFFSSTVEYHKNMALELGYTTDTIIFRYETSCWGDFVEDPSSSNVSLHYGAFPCDEIPEPPTGGAPRHAGSTLCAFDRDGDGDKDLLLGDLSNDIITYLNNGGDTGTAIMDDADSIYPHYDVTYQHSFYPAAFHLDLDNDGWKDIVIAPHEEQGAINDGNVSFYKNVGSASDVTVELQTDSFLVNQMIDVGDDALPVFFDHNADGLMDLIVGNFGYFEEGTNLFKPTKFSLYENTGTATEPHFTLLDEDWMNISAMGTNSVYPTFGDIDNDGDEDMIVGEEDGFVHLFINNPSGGDANLSLTVPNLGSIDVGQFSKPFLKDFDFDGDLDLVIGRKDGKLSYYPNVGSASSPVFSTGTVNHNFGNIDINDPFFLNGMSTPYVSTLDTATGSTEYLFVGSEQGLFYIYEIDTSMLMGGSFTHIDTSFGKIDEGGQVSLAIADITNDGKYEVLMGNRRGGVSLYSQTVIDSFKLEDTVATPPPTPTPSVTVVEPTKIGEFTIYPNPTSKEFYLEALESETFIGRLDVTNLLGEKVIEREVNLQGAQAINVQKLQRGIYIVRLYNEAKSFEQKLIIE